MNHYDSEISLIIKSMFPRGTDFNVPALLDVIRDFSRREWDDSDAITAVKNGILKETGTTPTPEHIENILRNIPVQLMWELMNILYGVTIYVNTETLLEAVMRTNIEALMGDVRLPFPVCEFVFPEHFDIGNGYQASGCLLADVKTAPVETLLKRSKYPWNVVTPLEVTNVFFSRLIRNNFGDTGGVSWLQFNANEPLDSVPKKVPVNKEDQIAVRTMCRLCYGLCLYCQTAEGQKAIEPFTLGKRAARKGAGITEMELHRKRKHYVMQDLITHTFREPCESQDGTHASPKTHWRKLHLRTLRHEKYIRNLDGSVRAIWIKPTLVNPSNDMEKTERKI
jgi:hypothetical protein